MKYSVLVFLCLLRMSFETGSKCHQFLNKDAAFSLAPLSYDKDFNYTLGGV
jgi:hypothetical protein